MGRALGSGVVCGLGVSLKASTDLNRPVLTVEPGRAVNARGAVMELSSGVDVALTRESATGSGPEAIFTDCRPLQPGTYIAGVGAYVLTVAPARRGVGRAPVSGLQNAQAQCNVAYSLEGVQFTLLRVALPAGVLADPDRTRNRVAHLMAGTSSAERVGALADPLAPSPTALRDARRAGGAGLHHRRPGAPRLPPVDRLGGRGLRRPVDGAPPPPRPRGRRLRRPDRRARPGRRAGPLRPVPGPARRPGPRRDPAGTAGRRAGGEAVRPAAAGRPGADHRRLGHRAATTPTSSWAGRGRSSSPRSTPTPCARWSARGSTTRRTAWAGTSGSSATCSGRTSSPGPRGPVHAA